MNTFTDLADKMEAQLKVWESARVELALEMAFDVTALVKSRVINDRVNELGNSFGEYAESTQVVKIKKGRTRSVADALFDSGFSSLPFPNVNFSDTNQLWNQTGPQVKEQDDNLVRVRIEPRGDRKEVLGYLVNRYGDIIALSESEKEYIVEFYDTKLDQIFNVGLE